MVPVVNCEIAIVETVTKILVNFVGARTEIKKIFLEKKTEIYVFLKKKKNLQLSQDRVEEISS
jgi:hypothetical protein